MGVNDVFGRITPDAKTRVLARDKRRCHKCLRYFGEHRPLYVVVLDEDKPVTDDRNLATVCSECATEYEMKQKVVINH